jgi:hypothetical protein
MFRVTVQPIKETNMPAPEKDVTISSSGQTITVKILFAGTPNYDPLNNSKVTATKVAIGAAVAAQTVSFTGKKITGGAQFQATNVPEGNYDVSVTCTDATFGQIVPVAAGTNTSHSFRHFVPTA